MNHDITLKQALRTWEQSNFRTDEHLSLKRLYEMGQQNGLKQASPYELEHLSLCPECFDHLQLIQLAVSSDIEADDDDVYEIIGYGLLKAASAGVSEPFETRSDCGDFILSVYPEVGSTTKGMIVLATTHETERFNGLEASVRDASGKVILKAKITQGRAAVKQTSLDQLDLSGWTIILSNQNPGKPHE